MKEQNFTIIVMPASNLDMDLWQAPAFLHGLCEIHSLCEIKKSCQFISCVLCQEENWPARGER